MLSATGRLENNSLRAGDVEGQETLRKVECDSVERRHGNVTRRRPAQMPMRLCTTAWMGFDPTLD